MPFAGPVRRDAVTVEIAYAVIPSVLLIGVGVAAALLLSAVFGLRGHGWNVAGAVGPVLLLLAALLRTTVILVKATRRGL